MSSQPLESNDPGLALLTGDTAAEFIGAVLSASGGSARSWSVRQVDHQPGRRSTVCYSVRVNWADGSSTDETLGAACGELPDGVLRVTDGHTEVGVWRFPDDPLLPGLAAACDERRMHRMVERLGVGGAMTGLRVRAYRPGRRAVIEVRTTRGALFVKVVRPRRARGLHERHRIAEAAGCPVPASLGWSDDGLVVQAGLPGRTLRARLTGPEPSDVDPDGVLGVLDTLPERLRDAGPVRTWGQRATHYADLIAAVAPELAGRARAVAAAVDHRAPEGPRVAVHGDFYENQLMVRGGDVTGLLDIDTAGGGERLDDAGCLLAHLSVLAQIRAERAAEITEFGGALWRRFSRRLDPAALHRRTAAAVLSLATGPHRVQETGWPAKTGERIALAERWLDVSHTRKEMPRWH